MKLQKQLSRRIGNKEYDKWVAVIPPKIVQQARLKDGDKLKIEVKNNKIIIEKES